MHTCACMHSPMNGYRNMETCSPDTYARVHVWVHGQRGSGGATRRLSSCAALAAHVLLLHSSKIAANQETATMEPNHSTDHEETDLASRALRRPATRAVHAPRCPLCRGAHRRPLQRLRRHHRAPSFVGIGTLYLIRVLVRDMICCTVHGSMPCTLRHRTVCCTACYAVGRTACCKARRMACCLAAHVPWQSHMSCIGEAESSGSGVRWQRN